MKCPICSQEINDNSKFCGKCGNKVPRCPSCGKVIYKRTKFCSNDGTVIPEEVLALLPERQSEPMAAKTVKYEESGSSETAVTAEPKKKSILPVMIGFSIALILIIGGIVAYFLFSGKLTGSDSEKEDTEQTVDSGEWKLEDEENEETMADSVEETVEETTAAKEETTAAPVEETTTAEETTEAVEMIHTYEVVSEDVSWSEAKALCEEMGGYLATVTTKDEYEEICALAEESGLKYLWLGAGLRSDADEWGNDSWITGEEWNFEKWYPGEPSKQDADGTREFYLCLWNAKYDGNEIGWTFNDQREDIVASFPSVSGSIGFICEYEVEAN